MYGIISGNEFLEKSLNPHCVSFMEEVAGGVMRRIRRWNACIRKLRSLERYGNSISVMLTMELIE